MRSPALSLLLIAALASTAAMAGPHDRSINWDSTVSESVPRVDRGSFRYDVDLSSASVSQAKSKDVCLSCAPAAAYQLSDSERLDQRLRRGYRQFGEDLASRLWADPKGRRVRFDVEGRPGLGLEIPFN